MTDTTLIEAVASEPQFSGSLERLASRIDWIPIGWHRPYIEMLVRLRATACNSRAHLVLKARPIEANNFIVGTSDADRIVEGIIRKFDAKIKCTCSICGKRGKSSWVAGFQKILCPTCLAPRLMHQELRKFTRKLAQDDGATDNVVVGEMGIPSCLRLLIPAEYWTTLHGPRNDDQIKCMTSKGLSSLQPRFNAIKSYLAELIEQHA